jgi:hypothetical protein
MRRVAAVVLGMAGLALAPAARADLDDGRCDGDLPPRSERIIRVQQDQRRTFGLPRSREHVLRVLRAGNYFGVSSFAVTPQEERWLNDGNVVASRAAEVERYARKHAPDSYGGSASEAKWPRPAYLVSYFTRDVARHQRALDRRLDRKVRAVKVRYTYAHLRKVQDGIDQRALAQEGIRFVLSAPNVRLNRVRLVVITARRNAAEVVRRLYGGAIRVEVVAHDDWRPICEVGDSYTLSADGRELTIHYWSVPAYRFHRLELRETGPGVRVAVRELVPRLAHPPDCQFRSATVRLAAPLGDRKVVDGETGRNLPPGDTTPHRDCRDRYYATQRR